VGIKEDQLNSLYSLCIPSAMARFISVLRSNSPWAIAAAGDAVFDRYLYAKGALPADDAPIAPDMELAATKGRVSLELPADSFAILAGRETQ